MNLVHIESRKSKRRNSEFEIFVDCDSNREQLNEIFQLLKSHVSIVSMNPTEHFNVQEDGGKYRGQSWQNHSSQCANLKRFYFVHMCTCIVFSMGSCQVYISVPSLHGFVDTSRAVLPDVLQKRWLFSHLHSLLFSARHNCCKQGSLHQQRPMQATV